MDTSQAACTTAPPDIFFPEGRNKLQQEKQAKQVCASCNIEQECLKFAIENNELGIWGGTTEDERRHIKVIIK
jgi:WhiB family redox-sensing transcriptional regulator